MNREELIPLLVKIREGEELIKGIQAQVDADKARLKTALEADPQPIVDGEFGLVAHLVDRNKPAEVDMISFAKRGDAERLLREAAEQGLLTARVGQLKGMKGRSEAADALLAVTAPGGTSQYVSVEAVK